MKTKFILFICLTALFSLAQAQYPSHPNDPYSQRSPRHHGGDDHGGYDDYGDDGCSPGERIQLALILDASGSMNGLIEQAKSQLWNIVNELTWGYEGHGEPFIEIALYEYGSSDCNRHNGYIRQLTPFTQDFDWVSESLFTIRTGGKVEYCGVAIEDAVRNLRWSRHPEDAKMIFIAGNESFAQGPVDYRSAIRRATQQGIMVNTIYCGPMYEGIHKYWEDAAIRGQGQYASIDHDHHSRPRGHHSDGHLSRLNQQWNNTYVPYGTHGHRSFQRMSAQDRNASHYGQGNLAQRTMVKSSGTYHAESWDLVDAVSRGKADLRSIPNQDLPENMRSMSLAQKQTFIRTKQNERNQLRQQIQSVASTRKAASRKAEAFQPHGGRSLDKAIISSTKKKVVVRRAQPTSTTRKAPVVQNARPAQKTPRTASMVQSSRPKTTRNLPVVNRPQPRRNYSSTPAATKRPQPIKHSPMERTQSQYPERRTATGRTTQKATEKSEKVDKENKSTTTEQKQGPTPTRVIRGQRTTVIRK